jgi:hypothetical protein
MMSLPQCLHTLAAASIFSAQKGQLISLRDEVFDLPKITAKSPPRKQTDPNIR